MSKVMTQSAIYENARQAVDRAFELSPKGLKGKIILIKRTLNCAQPEAPALISVLHWPCP